MQLLDLALLLHLTGDGTVVGKKEGNHTRAAAGQLVQGDPIDGHKRRSDSLRDKQYVRIIRIGNTLHIAEKNAHITYYQSESRNRRIINMSNTSFSVCTLRIENIVCVFTYFAYLRIENMRILHLCVGEYLQILRIWVLKIYMFCIFTYFVYLRTENIRILHLFVVNFYVFCAFASLRILCTCLGDCLSLAWGSL